MSGRKCATPFCNRPERWISVYVARTASQPFPRHCVSCCDAIGQLVSLGYDPTPDLVAQTGYYLASEAPVSDEALSEAVDEYLSRDSESKVS